MTKSTGLLALLLFTIASAQLTAEQKIHFYEDCTIFNDTKLYGGEICGSDGNTYSNSLFLDCINHHRVTDGKFANDGSQRKNVIRK